MDVESDVRETSMKTLLKYRELAENDSNHGEMLKDKTVLHFLAYVLDDADEEILKASLDTIDLLGRNSSNRPFIIRTFGVVQSLEYLAEDKRTNNALRERAKAIAEMIKTSEDQTKSKEKVVRNKKMLTLHVCGLHESTRKDLEDILMKKVKGVHSVIVDVEHQRCTVTAYENLEPKLLASALRDYTNMEARLVSRNKFDQEVLVSLMDDSKQIDLQELPPYLEEKDTPVKEKAVRSMKEMRIVASEWFSVAAGILQQSFYW